ncbi:MAG: hypothetical protein AAGG48_21035 [Planctomycetota bacterium]
MPDLIAQGHTAYRFAELAEHSSIDADIIVPFEDDVLARVLIRFNLAEMSRGLAGMHA